MQEPSSDSTAEPAWEQLRPVLDAAMHQLNERDRHVVLLRFFEGRSLADVGAKLGLSEDAARKRVGRALDELRELLARQGVTSTAAVLATMLSGHAVAAAPVGLAASVAGTALASAGTSAGAG